MRIKELRKASGMSQARLATILSVTQQTVAKWESKKSAPTADKIPIIAKALDCSIDDLFSSKED